MICCLPFHVLAGWGRGLGVGGWSGLRRSGGGCSAGFFATIIPPWCVVVVRGWGSGRWSGRWPTERSTQRSDIFVSGHDLFVQLNAEWGECSWLFQVGTCHPSRDLPVPESLSVRSTHRPDEWHLAAGSSHHHSRAAATRPAVQGAGQPIPLASPRRPPPRAIGFLARVSGFRKSGPAKTAWLCSPPIGRCKPLSAALNPLTQQNGQAARPRSTLLLVFLHWPRALRSSSESEPLPSSLPWPEAASTASVERAVSNCLPIAACRLSGTERVARCCREETKHSLAVEGENN